MIPVLDLKKQIAPIREDIDAAIKKVIDNTNFILGEEVTDFENEITKYTGVKYAIGVCNGTDAIKLALLASGIKCGDGVICPAFTYYATAGAIASMGARPIFADIGLDTYNISIEAIEKGAYDFVLKPLHLAQLLLSIDRALHLAQLAKNYNFLKTDKKYLFNRLFFA